jgi:ATP/ADP translocase
VSFFACCFFAFSGIFYLGRLRCVALRCVAFRAYLRIPKSFNFLFIIARERNKGVYRLGEGWVSWVFHFLFFGGVVHTWERGAAKGAAGYD